MNQRRSAPNQRASYRFLSVAGGTKGASLYGVATRVPTPLDTIFDTSLANIIIDVRVCVCADLLIGSGAGRSCSEGSK